MRLRIAVSLYVFVLSGLSTVTTGLERQKETDDHR